MTRDETKTILYIVSSNYPKDYESADLSIIADTWYELFKSYDRDLIYKAVMNHIATSPYPPKPAHITEQIEKMTDPELMGETEAFGLVEKAVTRSSWHAEEEFDKLPDIVKRVVGNPDQLKQWAQMYVDDFERLIRPSFVRDYRNQAEREREYRRLPADVRAQIDQVNPPRVFGKHEHPVLIEDRTEPLQPEESVVKIEAARAVIGE